MWYLFRRHRTASEMYATLVFLNLFWFSVLISNQIFCYLITGVLKITVGKVSSSCLLFFLLWKIKRKLHFPHLVNSYFTYLAALFKKLMVSVFIWCYVIDALIWEFYSLHALKDLIVQSNIQMCIVYMFRKNIYWKSIWIFKLFVVVFVCCILFSL